MVPPATAQRFQPNRSPRPHGSPSYRPASGSPSSPPCFTPISYIFHIFWAPGAPGPVPNYRSHFSAQTRVIESFWNPQNTSFMTKKCPKTFHQVFPLVFLLFSLFFELLKLWDQCQIVDLIFPLKPESSRASETPKTLNSWQNNVPKRSTKYSL